MDGFKKALGMSDSVLVLPIFHANKGSNHATASHEIYSESHARHTCIEHMAQRHTKCFVGGRALEKPDQQRKIETPVLTCTSQNIIA